MRHLPDGYSDEYEDRVIEVREYTLTARKPNSGAWIVVMFTCPFCEGELEINAGFNHHWCSCPVNPSNGGDGVF